MPLPAPRPAALALVALALLAGCADTPRRVEPAPAPRPADARALIAQALPPATTDRAGWAADIYAALSVLGVPADAANACAVIAVAEQESGLQADPPVPGLARIARAEIDRRADAAGVPRLLVSAALALESPTGRSYAERLDNVRTEKGLSEIFEDFIGMAPLGERLFGKYNPVRTGGPMQVSIAFAEAQAKAKPYPYPMAGSVRHEVFTRRGGLYFGTAHLLDYPAPYDRLLYRYADFNAGHYASRNAAFQQALSTASGVPLELDGDLIRFDADAARPGATELAARTLRAKLELSDAQIRRALEQGTEAAFEGTALYRRVFALAEALERRTLPRAVMPRIALKSPKIRRPLTTEWFASRVEERWKRCVARAGESG